MEKIIFLAFFILASELAFAQPVALTGNVDLSLTKHFRFFHDPSAKVGFPQIQQKKFNMKSAGGFYKGNVWASTQLCNRQKHDVYLIYKDPIDSISVYTNRQGLVGEYSALKTAGRASTFWPEFQISIQGCETIYIKAHSGDIMNFNYSILSKENLNQYHTAHVALYSSYYTLIFISLLISILFFIFFRKIEYFYFSMLLVFQDILGASLLNGYLFKYIISVENFVRYDLGNIFAPLMNAALLAFTLNFLKVKPGIERKIGYGLVLSQIAIAVYVVVGLSFGFHHQNPVLSNIVNQSILLSCIIAMLMAAIQWQTVVARLFFALTGVKVIGQVLKTYLLQGDIPEHFYFAPLDLSFSIFNIGALGSLIEATGVVCLMVFYSYKELGLRNKEIEAANTQNKILATKATFAGLAAQVAHDIRSPVMALRVAVNNLNTQPEASRKLIIKATERVQGIAEDLLARKRDLQPVDVIEVTEQVVREKLWESKGAKIQLKIAQENHNAVAAAGKQDLARVISNLINNSIEAYTNDQPNIGVEVGVKNNTINLKIMDSGKGISPEHLKQFSSGSSYTDKSLGHGMGLSSAKRLVDSWGGSLTIESEPGKGTEVSIELPAI